MKGPKRANRWILWLYKFEKTFYFGDWFLFKLQGIFSSCKGCEVLNKVWERGPICQYLSWQMYVKGWGVEPWGRHSCIKLCWVPPWGLETLPYSKSLLLRIKWIAWPQMWHLRSLWSFPIPTILYPSRSRRGDFAVEDLLMFLVIQL